ncbi:helix-turn-helix transcriptional regulator [Vagococcus sp.]|uniref:helix-turn-helix transcriptional regulator n=1 Tax=Vagococcus sp. TaxID=1933889 RepID=UPI002FC84F44
MCTQATISNLESNRTLPNAQTLKLIADRLMIDFNDLMDSLPNKNEILQLAKASLRMKDYEKVRKILIKNSNLKKLSNNEVK